MTQMERIKLCVRVTQGKMEGLLLRVRLEAMETALHKMCVTFTQKVGIIPFRK